MKDLQIQNVNSDAVINNPRGTIGNTPFNDTTGKIDVNGSGQLQFTLPIALPPGVKSVAPQINLVYTSGGGNGIAGYGFNISGTTSITRMGKTLEKDGETKGVQLDYSDFYQFNGQRLILKSGEYGKDGAEYTTEKYSNIRIKSVGVNEEGTGPFYFEVTFEDGSQAWYGDEPFYLRPIDEKSDGRTLIEYNIVKWKDAQGNYISYKYNQSFWRGDNVTVIRSIGWGGNEIAGTSNFNSIVFNYLDRDSREISYVSGKKFSQFNILSNIEVRTSEKLFKKYSIEYKRDDKGNKYQFVKSITESNSKGETANPVIFNYQDSQSSEWKDVRITNTKNTSVLYGDFNGDGKMDVLRYLSEDFEQCLESVDGVDRDLSNADGFFDRTIYKALCNKSEKLKAGLYLFNSVFDDNRPKRIHTGDTSLTDEDIKNSMAISLKTAEGDILTRQGFVTYKYLPGTGIGDIRRDMEIKTYSVNPDTFGLQPGHVRIIPAYFYDKSFPFTNETYNLWGETTVDSIKEIDLDGDGRPELIFIIKDTTYEGYGKNKVYETKYRYFIVNFEETDLGKWIYEINIPLTTSNFFGSEVKQGDFDGDGIVDFISFDGSGRGLLTNLKKNSLGKFEPVTRLYSETIIEGLRTEAVVGDFTGDGKSDLMVPQAEDSENWKLYLSTGKGFEVQNLNSFALFKKSEYFRGNKHSRSMNRHFFAQDLNKDGKADLIEFYSHVYSGSFDESRFIIFYHENKGVDMWGNVVFEKKNIDGHWETPRPWYDQGKRWYPDEYDTTQTNVKPYALARTAEHFFPAIGDFKVNNYNENILIIQRGRLVRYSHYNVSQEARIKSITQGDVVTEVEYKELDPNINPGFYAAVKKEKFPYIEMDKLSGSFAVSRLSQSFKKQDFKYRGFIGHLQGKGMVGFRQVARSSWYSDWGVNSNEVFKIWSGVENDPLNENLPIKEWTVRAIDDDSLIFPTDLSVNNNQLLSFKSTEYRTEVPSAGIKAIVPVKTISKDFLKDITEESSIKYGAHYLPEETITHINGDFATSTTIMKYIHNPGGIGKDYFIGRPESKTEIVTAYNDTKSAKEEYIYESNLLKYLKTYNRDNSGWVQEKYEYDKFGNITEKTIANSMDTMIQTEKSLYDSKGRFVVNKTDNLGLETVIEYNDWGQILTQTDPLGNVLTNTYDGWGKIETSKTNLEGTTTHTYQRFPGEQDAMGGYHPPKTIITKYGPDGSIEESTLDMFGQVYQVKTKGFNSNSHILVSTNYDVFGRKTGVSEPYFEGDVPKWNTFSYDDSVFPSIVTAVSFNGKELKTTILGRATIVEELNGYKRVTKKVTDALENIISSEDKGGVINFSYNAAGEQVRAQYGNNIVTTKYDIWGRKSEFYDPSNGLYKYEYNGSGQIKKEVSPKGYKEYIYNEKGQLITQVEKSNKAGLTDKSISISYNDKGLVTGKTGTSNGKVYSNTIVYDTYGRLLERSENSNGRTYSQKDIIYDDVSRIISHKKELISGGVTTSTVVEHIYDVWSGLLFQIKDKSTDTILWTLQQTNAKGQVIDGTLGAARFDNDYDDYGFLNYSRYYSPKATLFHNNYVFDAVKNELKERTRQGGIQEVFTYDDNNRLVQWTNPKTGGISSNIYDVQGRITENDQVGTIQFGDTAKVYQPTGAKLNTIGKQNYLNAQIQRIIYNENNDPLYIQSKKGDVRFQYGLTNMRQMVTYGGDSAIGSINDLANSTWEGEFTKYYSEDGSFEVIRNNTTGEEKQILYIGGTPYESNIVYLKEFTQSSGSYKFLHKDYLGSILAVSDEEGNLLQEAHFDAWGQLTAGSVSLLGRGYTSHEHFEDIGIIHMNGRLYDPLLRRFLNADENIQDPYNTQIYNKYGYVMNNPLLYNDPSGEFFIVDDIILSAVIIGAIIGAGTYIIQAAITGNWDWGGFIKSIFFGAISGAVTAGIGNIFTTTVQGVQVATKFAETALGVISQAAAHGVAQGALSLMQGGKFEQALISGMLGSLGAKLWISEAGKFASSTFGMVTFGAIAGGIGSELTGGNFWQGVVIGGMVAGLNDALHKIGEKAQVKYILEHQLEDAGYDPWKKPTVSKEYADKMIHKVGVLKAQYELGGNRGKVAGITYDNSYNGKTIVSTGDIYLSNGSNTDTFKSNISLSVRLFHELKHVVYYHNPSFSSMLKYSGQKREDYQHFLIYKEINNVLLNGTGTFGTFGNLKDLQNKYGWK
ncbi:VCBS repeat-containing protein [Elizabethkingia anophelis]|uniref:FG-GAP-like repeat-containing protein n=1 Tax=Elizabethkingia anophelis TaxID=1117645 RepID=UPI0020B2A081|nr:FG-GAP-like repeat-containing protein [Elizabethkingia anophelis]UTF99026.1 VCBS repeat-containing protein [Elizabethkingia anophelis]UTG63784.1 VCBS repeat-containing protein [Elizabethkingia anophelis]